MKAACLRLAAGLLVAGALVIAPAPADAAEASSDVQVTATTGQVMSWTPPTSTDTVGVQSTHDSDNNLARTVMTIKSVVASHEYRFPLHLPPGVAPTMADNGAVALTNTSGQTISEFAPPWAHDKNGAPVSTKYRLDGNTLVQTVYFNTNNAFPIIADPCWSWLQWACTAGHYVWQGTKCTAAVTAAFIPQARAYKAIKELGGVAKTVELLRQAGKASDFGRIAGNAAVEILGVDSIVKNCLHGW